MASCGSLLEEAAPYNNKKQSKTENKREEQLRSGMYFEVVAGSGGVPTETGGRLLFIGSATVHPFPLVSPCMLPTHDFAC